MKRDKPHGRPPTAVHIYLVVCRINGKNYVGITKRSVRRRWREHVVDASKGALHRAIQKYGEDAFTVETIATALDWRAACEAEKHLIAAHKSHVRMGGYNLTSGGEGVCDPSDDEREKKRARALAFHAAIRKCPELRAARAALHSSNGKKTAARWKTMDPKTRAEAVEATSVMFKAIQARVAADPIKTAARKERLKRHNAALNARVECNAEMRARRGANLAAHNARQRLKLQDPEFRKQLQRKKDVSRVRGQALKARLNGLTPCSVIGVTRNDLKVRPLDEATRRKNKRAQMQKINARLQADPEYKRRQTAHLRALNDARFGGVT